MGTHCLPNSMRGKGAFGRDMSREGKEQLRRDQRGCRLGRTSGGDLWVHSRFEIHVDEEKTKTGRASDMDAFVQQKEGGNLRHHVGLTAGLAEKGKAIEKRRTPFTKRKKDAKSGQNRKAKGSDVDQQRRNGDRWRRRQTRRSPGRTLSQGSEVIFQDSAGVPDCWNNKLNLRRAATEINKKAI